MNSIIRHIFSLVALLLTFCFQAMSQSDSSRIQRQTLPWLYATDYFQSNPAAGYSLPYKEISEIKGSSDFGRADAGLHSVQEGNGLSNYRFSAESFQTEGKQRFFGKAYFETTRKRNTAWTDVLDADLLEPYIVADSVGGTYKGETYYISGGTSWIKDHFEWAIRGEYKGTVAYRDVDPRPKNTVSELRIQPGFTYTAGNWDYGLGLEYCRYRQNVDIEIEKDDKKVFFYLMQGFGIYNVQFSSLEESFERNYKGNLFQSAWLIHYVGQQLESGLELKAGYNDLKVVEDDKRTPYKLKQFFLNPLWNLQKQVKEQTLFVNASYAFRQSIGNETQYSPEVINVSNVVWIPFTKSDRYRHQLQTAELTLLLANKNLNKFSVWEKLNVLWTHSQRKYIYPDYKQSVTNLETRLSLGFNIPIKRALLVSSFDGGYRKNLSSSLYQEENNIITKNLILPDFEFLSTDYFIGKWTAGYGRKISNNLSAMLSGYVQMLQTGSKQALFAGSSLTFSF